MSPTRFLKNTELELEHIPLPGAELRDIGRFADTLRAEHREHQTLLEDTIKNYTEQRILPHSLTELRACLALEWAILPHISREPNPKQEQFLRDLVANIRSKVFAGEVE